VDRGTDGHTDMGRCGVVRGMKRIRHVRDKLRDARRHRSAERRQLIHANVDGALSRELSTVLFESVCKSVDVVWYSSEVLMRKGP
jgi:hypothetical protein